MFNPIRSNTSSLGPTYNYFQIQVSSSSFTVKPPATVLPTWSSSGWPYHLNLDCLTLCPNNRYDITAIYVSNVYVATHSLPRFIRTVAGSIAVSSQCLSAFILSKEGLLIYNIIAFSTLCLVFRHNMIGKWHN